MAKDGNRIFYEHWLSLTPEQQAEYTARGLHPDKAELIRRPDEYEVLEHAAVTPASEVEALEEQAEQQAKHTLAAYSKEDMFKMVNAIINAIVDTAPDNSTKLHILCVQNALGIGNPPRQCDLAKQFGMTRAGVNFRIKTIQHSLHLPPSHLMRSEKVCQTYRERALKVHLRNKKTKRPPKTQE